MVSSINSGSFLVNFRGHGGSRNFNYPYDGWITPPFNQDHIVLLNNGNMLPVMFSMACQTGWFDGGSDNYINNNEDCFGELLLSKENGGVSGFIGSIRSSARGYNDELCYGFYDAIWPDFDPNNENSTPIYRLGMMKDYGLLYMKNGFVDANSTFVDEYDYTAYDLTPGRTRRQFEGFHVLGDPSMEIWTGVPQPLYAYVDYEQNSVTISGSGGSAQAMYNDAQDKVAIEDYAGAQTVLQQIVTDFPTSNFAQTALRELYSLEEYATDDYTGLKTYYNTEAVIQNNPDLAKLAEYLTNFCEIKLENYPTAISWFENVIQNPETIDDSIFAIIDLGYTYYLMENGGLKSAYTGNMIEHIPVSKKLFEEKRDYLLTLLYKGSQTNENLEQELKSLKENELLQNIPNPFSGITDIYYKLDKEATVGIHVYDYSGRQIQTINGQGTKGLNKVQFDSSGLPAGVYFYNLEINGNLSDSKKMTILK